MKFVLVILVLTLVPQIALASIFDSFKQAMSSISNSVGKMITTVAFDVKETIDCTLLALEHSLSITLFKEYNKRCNGIDNMDSVDITEDLTEAVLQMASDKVIEDFSEFESNAKTKMKTICGIPEDELDLDNIRKLLLHNSGRLRVMDEFLKKQLALLPNLNMMDSVLAKDTECSVEEVLNKIKALIDTVKKVQDQKVDDDIADILKEMLHILNGDHVTAADITKHLPSGLLKVAGVENPDINIVLLDSEIEKENDYDISTTYEATLAHSSEQPFEYDNSQDMNIAEDTVTDYDNSEEVINKQEEYIEPMAAEVITNNSDSESHDSSDDDLDSIVKYIMAQNDEEDSSESDEESESTVDNVLDISSLSGFEVPMPIDLNTENSKESYPDDDLMRKVTEILRDQPHTELVMGSLIH